MYRIFEAHHSALPNFIYVQQKDTTNDHMSTIYIIYKSKINQFSRALKNLPKIIFVCCICSKSSLAYGARRVPTSSCDQSPKIKENIHGLINYKGTKTKCRHLKNWPVKGLCGSGLFEFINWRYSLVGIFDPALWTIYYPSNLLSGSSPSPLPPFLCQSTVHTDSVWLKRGGVCWVLLATIFCRSKTLCWPEPEPTKMKDHPKEKPSRGGGLRQTKTCRKVSLRVNLFRWRHFALHSISQIFLREHRGEEERWRRLRTKFSRIRWAYFFFGGGGGGRRGLLYRYLKSTGKYFSSSSDICLRDDALSPYGKSTVHNPATIESQRRPVLHNQRLILSACNERKKLYIQTII